MLTDHTFRSITDWLDGCSRPLLLSHQRPDGDAIGSLAAMSLVLRASGKNPAVALFDAFPPRYSLLMGACAWLSWEESRGILADDCDAVVILDTCSLSQLEPAVEYLRDAPPMLVIDHHVTHDDLAGRADDLRIIDPTASANCLLLTEWMEATGVKVTADIARALLVGIGTDCGWFRYSNTDARTLRAVCRLIEAGADPAATFNAVYQQEPAAKLRLIARLLSSVELHAEGKLAVMYLRPADFAAAGADRSMTEDLVNEAGRLAGVEATIMFTEESDGLVRVNLRSKSTLDVAEVARRYGGGGHARAAGAKLRGGWDRVVQPFIRDVVEVL